MSQQQWGQPGQYQSQPSWGQQRPLQHGQTRQQTQWGQPPQSQAPWGQPQQRSPYGGHVAPYGQSGQQGGWGAPSGAPTSGGGGMSKLLLGGLAVLAIAVVGLMLVNALGGNKGGTDVAYQNESYQVPPVDTNPPELAVPTQESELKTWTQDNPLYKQSVPSPTRCEMPNLNLSAASETQVLNHLNELSGCLMRVWANPIQDAGWKPVRFKSNVYGNAAIQTPCGKIPAKNAVFCYGNQQMYYSTALPQILPPELRDKPFVVETVLAHEFGHGIQGRTGIAASAIYSAEQASSKPEKNQWHRRVEVQADCFAGQFVASVAQSKGMTSTDVDNIKKVLESIGDDALTGKANYDGDHGLSATRAYWMQMGLASTSIGACNTFVAPPERVR